MRNAKPVKAYRKQPVTFVIEEDGLNIITKTPFVLYLNTDNEVFVEVDKVKDEDVQLIIPRGGVVTSRGNGQFLVRVKQAGRIIIDIYNSKKGKKISSASFEVREPGENTSPIPRT